MGNTSTKERGGLAPDHHQHHHHHSRSSGAAGPSGSQHQLGQSSERASAPGSRGGRHSNRNLEGTLLGLGMSGRERDRDREREDYRTKEERRAEREKERQRERARERERSMKEESVDGGYLVTLGVYVGPEDYSLKVVRQLQIERRLAPFWKGLEDHEDNWTDVQLVAVVRGLPLPPADADPNSLGLPAAQRSRAQSYASDKSPSSSSAAISNVSLPVLSASSSLLRPRAKTLGISAGSKIPNTASIPGSPMETNIGNGTINNRPVEAVLYKEASECPICFLYYPPHLNRTRCCDQPICSECFVQIKRADPHPPEFSPPNSPNARPADDTPSEQLVSEPASCPFCKEMNFGITYTPPPFRRGIVFNTQQHPYSPHHKSSLSQLSATSSSSSLPSSPTGTTPRRSKVAYTSAEVITTDMIRPDWSAKLAHARNQQARRAAAATALHTAAFLMGGMGGSSSSGAFSRRFRRANHSNDNSNNNSNHANHTTASGSSNNVSNLSSSGGNNPAAAASSSGESASEHQHHGPPILPNILGGGGHHGGSSSAQRRSRLMDLEEMMLMEAIRLSLAEEEERKRKEEKENKKKEKEDKAKEASGISMTGKGKMPEMKESEQQLSSSAPAGPSNAAKHTMQKQEQQQGGMLTRTSTGSSQESGPRGRGGPLDSTSNLHSGAASGDEDDGAGNEPMFNFQSLAETIMSDEEEESSKSGDQGGVRDVSKTGSSSSQAAAAAAAPASTGHSGDEDLASKSAAVVKESSTPLKELPDTKEQRA